MPERRAVRVVPENPVTVAIEADSHFEFGVVANISDLGVCIWSDGDYAVGDQLALQLSFAREPAPLQAAGRVVWSDARRRTAETVRYGLEWVNTVGSTHGRLRLLLSHGC